MKTVLNADIAAALAAVKDRRIDHVFLVACGGSLSVMMPGKYFLDRHSLSLCSDAMNADEFVYRNPQRLGPNAIVILCSQTGSTKETVRAAHHAKAKGAICLGMTLDPESPLAKAVDFTITYQASYTTGIPIDAADSNYAVLYMLLAGLLQQYEGTGLVIPLLASLSQLQKVIDIAHETYAARFEAYAPRYQSVPAIYTLASGPAYGAAYSFSTCVLMEMQWYASQAIHANEFFHGPFEVVDEKSCFIVLSGCDETRSLTLRARDFLTKYARTENILVLDAEELDLSSLDPLWVGYLVPLIFFDTLWRFAYRLADLRKRPMLEGRRYMKKLSQY